MTSTVPCPECHRPAVIVDHFSVPATSGPVEYLRLRCDGPLSFLVSTAELRPPAGSVALRAAS